MQLVPQASCELEHSVVDTPLSSFDDVLDEPLEQWLRALNRIRAVVVRSGAKNNKEDMFWKREGIVFIHPMLLYYDPKTRDFLTISDSSKVIMLRFF